jgi:hypothetical protein
MAMSAAIGWPPAKRRDRQLTGKVWRTRFPGSLENAPVVPDHRGSARLGSGRALIVSKSSMRESCPAADLLCVRRTMHGGFDREGVEPGGTAGNARSQRCPVNRARAAEAPGENAPTCCMGKGCGAPEAESSKPDLGGSCRWAAKRVHPSGLEPLTFGSVDRCSIQLS